MCRFSRKSLEAKSWALEKAKNWEMFNVVLALLIYGVVLFLDMDDFIYISIINIFLSKNPVPSLLADVYYYHHVKREKKKFMVICCVPMVYTWLMSQMPKYGLFIENNIRWPQKLAYRYAYYVVWFIWE